jgi:hypothetical protein
MAGQTGKSQVLKGNPFQSVLLTAIAINIATMKKTHYWVVAVSGSLLIGLDGVPHGVKEN